MERDTNSTGWVTAAIVALGVGIIITYHGALTTYFAQEDFRGIAAAEGIVPSHSQLWRYLSVEAWADVLYAVAGKDPTLYHAAGLLLHWVNASVLLLLLARVVSLPAALVGGMFFAAHPAHFTTMYWVSARADILALTFCLLTVAALAARWRHRWTAILLFAGALLSKESTVGLPLVAGIAMWQWQGLGAHGHRAAAGSRVAGSAGVLWIMAALGLGMVLYMISGAGGIVPRGAGREPYALLFGWNVVANTLTYINWSVDVLMLKPGLRFVDAVNPEAFRVPIVAMTCVVVACSSRALRKRGWVVGMCAFGVMLAPMLLLQNHIYRYYLYVPLAAVAILVAAVVDVGVEGMATVARARDRATQGGVARRKLVRGRGKRWVVAGGMCVCCILLVGNGMRVVEEMETRPSRVFPGLMGDPIVDRAKIARNMIESLKGLELSPGTRLQCVFRERLAAIGRVSQGVSDEAIPNQEVYAEANVRTAVFDGVGVRAMIPTVEHVRFVVEPVALEVREMYALYAPTGHIQLATAGKLDSLLASAWVRRW